MLLSFLIYIHEGSLRNNKTQFHSDTQVESEGEQGEAEGQIRDLTESSDPGPVVSSVVKSNSLGSCVRVWQEWSGGRSRVQVAGLVNDIYKQREQQRMGLTGKYCLRSGAELREVDCG